MPLRTLFVGENEPLLPLRTMVGRHEAHRALRTMVGRHEAHRALSSPVRGCSREQPFFPFHCWSALRHPCFPPLFPFHCWPDIVLPLPFPFHCWPVIAVPGPFFWEKWGRRRAWYTHLPYHGDTLMVYIPPFRTIFTRVFLSLFRT